jgi:1-acyl-sn-glycerol-3-phosphate acyltransferase
VIILKSKIQHPKSNDERMAALARINRDDLVKAWGFEHVQPARPLLDRLFRRPARRFARQMLVFDGLVGAAGLQAGGAWALGQFAGNVVVRGHEHLPASGPLLLAANHPGLYDTLALFAAIPRPDLRVIAADRPFLRALPNVSHHLISLQEDAPERMAVVRSATRHMRAGGAVLTFPGGHIEPDPAVLPGAVAALSAWSNSLALFARLVPDVTIVPIIVSGVFSPAALHHPLTWLRRRPEDRHLLAATLQLLFPNLQQGTLRVDIGPPLRHDQSNPESISQRVAASARQLIERVSTG